MTGRGAPAAGGRKARGGQPPEPIEGSGHTPTLRIGEAAARTGVSTRTLRYYEELGLLTPTGTTGGARRYSHTDLVRVTRIRHLRDLVGLDLNGIARVLQAEDRLAALRRQWWDNQTPATRADLLREAAQINTEMQDIVRAKLAGLQTFLTGLEERAAVIRGRHEDLDTENRELTSR